MAIGATTKTTGDDEFRKNAVERGGDSLSMAAAHGKCLGPPWRTAPDLMVFFKMTFEVQQKLLETINVPQFSPWFSI